MTQSIKAPTPTAVAVAFSKVLRGWLTKDQMVKVLALNKREKNPMVCHSHDFCDANMAMDAAIKKVAPEFYKAAWADNRKTDGEGKVWGRMNKLWNRSWAIAKEHYFYVGTTVPTEPRYMAHVRECQAPGCHYTTNVVGDLTRHRKERHS